MQGRGEGCAFRLHDKKKSRPKEGKSRRRFMKRARMILRGEQPPLRAAGKSLIGKKIEPPPSPNRKKMREGGDTSWCVMRRIASGKRKPRSSYCSRKVKKKRSRCSPRGPNEKKKRTAGTAAKTKKERKKFWAYPREALLCENGRAPRLHREEDPV